MGNDLKSPNPGGAGGNALLATTLVPNASGIFGTNDNDGSSSGDVTGKGVFGLGNSGDGVFGLTHSNNKNGVVGINDSTSPPQNVAGGNGVFGHSINPSASGIFGSNDAGGTGVFGNSSNGDGVFGITNSNIKSEVWASLS